MAEKEYQRLTRARPRARFGVISIGRTSLWLGKDHLLCIDSSGYTENYKRFYFRDIQSLVIRKTERHKYFALACAVLAFGCFLPSDLSSEVVVRYTFGSLVGLFVLIFLINLALGPATDCQIRTAVQTEDLPSLNRLRRARKVINRVRPFIVSAQGELKPEEIPPRVEELSGRPTEATMARSETSERIDDPNAPPRIL